MIDSAAPTVKLLHGAAMPVLGFGTWPLDDAEAADAVASAIDAGYRLFDTAENYRNEAGVGEGIRRAGIDRSEVFLTTKFNKEWHSYDGAARAFENSARLLGVEYLDLLLIHWPNPGQDRYLEAFQGLGALLADNRVRAIGTSNFKENHLARLFDEGLVPDVNQIQLDPRHTRSDVRQVHARNGIITESWSPLGKGGDLLEDATITALAEKYGKTPGQIVLRWHIQQGLVAIPKSAHPDRIRQNIDIFDFELAPEDLDGISALDTGVADIADSDHSGH